MTDTVHKGVGQHVGLVVHRGEGWDGSSDTQGRGLG